MDLGLNGQHVLITGGSKGIGLACAQGFLAEGARVSLVSRSQANLDEAVAELRRLHPQAQTVGISADLQDAAQAVTALARAEQAHGGVDVLVNSAGAAKRTPPDALNAAAWHDAMNAKFFTYVHMMDLVVKKMAAQGAGVIINVIGSGGKVASPEHLAGGAANAALMLVSSGLASAYAPRGVRVNAINPGLTLTDRMQRGLQVAAQLQQVSPDEALARAVSKIPLGRVAHPHEIADVVLFLASSKASYVTGVVLTMDGASTPMVV
jgi:NAD(P)-dependent dehydrogenase (short-subunit alcohol dehydrogenase family)